eukprot:gene5162-3710_t
MLTPSQIELVETAFRSMVTTEGNTVPLKDLMAQYDASEHPCVKAGEMAPSAARDTLPYQFGQCCLDHDGGVTLDEFMTYHEKMADEAHNTRAGDVNAFIEELIMRLWRLGDLLQPTRIRPAAPIDDFPRALYSKTLMSLIWPGVDEHGKSFLYCIKESVQPTFRRGDLPPPLQGFFAFPSEFMGFRVQYVAPQISVKRWLDFVWEYEPGKFAAVEGIISARVAKESLPPLLQQLVQEHSDVVKLPSITFTASRGTPNPMYKKTSETYGYRVHEACRKIHDWRWSSLAGKEYGLQYHGFVDKYFSKNGPVPGNAATGINM